MVSLKHLDLSDNKFSDSFPSLLISNLTSIESLVLPRNEFKGMVSLCNFANFSRLVYLDISENHLKFETDSPSCSPSFNLNALNLSGCNLTNIPSFLSTQNNLQLLDLSHNQLIGNIPSWLLYNVTSRLWLRGNNFSGPFPRNFQNKSSQLTILDISHNFLHGPLPKDIDLNFPRLRFLSVSMNSFNSNLPPSFSDQLQILDLSDNQFQGEIPHSMTRNMTSLEYFRLSRNNLTGDALPKNSSLPKIRGLYLYKNYFSGTFPDTLWKSMELEVVDIRDNSLSGELSSYLPVLPQLIVLVLDGNRLKGKIPLQVCQMRNLHILDLSKNILSGDIPNCVGNVTSWTGSDDRVFREDSFHFHLIIIKGKSRYNKSYMASSVIQVFKVIDVSSNRLTGKIPLQMTRLNGIIGLNMSNNLLTGQIPSSFGNLTNLEFLDLSNNNLFGALPPELTNLGSLAVFNVSYNNLSGMIPPQIAQFATFDDTSYFGNSGLCGFPVSRKCNDSAATQFIQSAETSVYLFSDIATEYTLVFWCVIFLLYLE
ncbi:hypothetical protein REPUB_Repub04eG0117800 [Reevesia pubescens]